jgi:hypothetical protein
MDLAKNSLAYTICQVPIIYTLSDNESIKVVFHESEEVTIKNHELDLQNSQRIFNRTNLIKAVHVRIIK